MKKIICFILAMLIFIPQYAVFAQAIQEGVIESVSDFSPPEKSGTFGTEVTFKGKEISISFHMSAEQIALLKDAVCDDNLSIDTEQSELYLNEQITFASIMGSEYIRISFNDKTNSNAYLIGITDEKVTILKIGYDSSMNPSKKEAGVYAIKNHSPFEKLYDVIYENALAESNKAREEYERNADDVENLKILYSAKFDAFGSELHFGFLSYNIKNESQTQTAAYYECREDGSVYYIIADSWQKDNTLYFSGEKNLFVVSENDFVEISDKFNKGQLYSNGSLIYDMKLNFRIDQTGNITEITAFRKRSGSSEYAKENINMSSFYGSQKFPDFDGFEYEINSTQNSAELMNISSESTNNVDIESKKDEVPSATPLPDYSSRDFLAEMKNGNAVLTQCSYTSEKDGKTKTLLKNRTQMNVYDTQKALETAFYGYQFTKTDVTDKFDTNSSKIRINCITDTSPKVRYEIYVFDGCIVIESTVPNPDKSVSRLTIPVYIRYTYSGESLVKKLTPHFDRWVDDSIDSDITYTDVSKLEAEYVAEFEFEADNEMLSSWIGEVCEAGKVKCKITYFDSLVMLTLSGNGKSYNLMRGSSVSGGSTFTNQHIGVEKDTPIPNEMAKPGHIHINWSTISGFYSKDNLFVRVYDSHGTQAGNPGTYGMIGSEKSVIKLGEVINNKTMQNTPVTEAEARGNVFADVPENHWAKDTIENYYYAGIVRGMGAGIYEPESTMTYEHFGILLKRLFDYDYVNASPAPAIRQDVIKALIDAMNLPYEEWDLSQYSDAELVKNENAGAVSTAVKENIVEGYAGSLNANGYLTRAEAITLIDRAVKLIYEIDETVKPEYYKTYILPSNGYTVISADMPTELKIKYETDNIYIKNDDERLNGKIVVTFGDDVINDSRVYGVFEADGNIFTAESIEFSQIIVRKNQYVLRGNVIVYKNGKVFDESRALNAVFNTEDQEVTFGTKAQTFYAYFENIRKTLGNEPKEPEVQPYEIEAAEWDGGLIIAGDVTEASVDELTFKSDETDVGAFSVSYNKNGDNARVSITIVKNNADGTKCTYVFSMKEVIFVSESEISGIFTMKRDGETVTENMVCKISGIEPKLKSNLTFENDKGTVKANLYVTETGK